MCHEEWRAIVGYEGLYEVSSLGRVRTCPKKVNGRLEPSKVRSSKPRTCGYPVVCLRKNGHQRSHYVHLLVLTAFSGPRPDGLECCHFDGDRTNNAHTNLRWATRAENMADKRRHGTQPTRERVWNARLTQPIADDIRARYRRGDINQKQLAAEFGISPTLVRSVLQNKSWTPAPEAPDATEVAGS